MMSKRMTKRALRLLSIHARDGEDTIDYIKFFKSLDSEERLNRYVSEFMGTRTAYSEAKSLPNGMIAFQFASGDANEVVSYYDLEEKIQRSVDQTNGFFSTPVWIIVSPSERLLAKEIRRPGVSDKALETYFEQYSRDRLGFKQPRFSLNPVPDKDFIKRLDGLEIIKRVDITLNQPNYDWGDSESRITAMAEESGASTATLSMTAKPKQSLEKDKGIVQDVEHIIKSGVIGPIKKIVIKGNQTAGEPEQTLNQKNYQRQVVTSFPSEAEDIDKFDRISSAGAQLIEDAVADKSDKEGGILAD